MEAKEIIKMVQEKLGYKSKAAFAKSLGRRVEIIDYSIKANRISELLEMLIVSKHQVRREFLRTGIEPILKVEYRTGECPYCQKKDEENEHLKEEIKMLKKYIELLEEINKAKGFERAV